MLASSHILVRLHLPQSLMKRRYQVSGVWFRDSRKGAQNYTSTFIDLLEHTTTWFDTLRHIAARYDTVRHAMTQFDTLRHISTHFDTL